MIDGCYLSFSLLNPMPSLYSHSFSHSLPAAPSSRPPNKKADRAAGTERAAALLGRRRRGGGSRLCRGRDRGRGGRGLGGVGERVDVAVHRVEDGAEGLCVYVLNKI